MASLQESFLSMDRLLFTLVLVLVLVLFRGYVLCGGFLFLTSFPFTLGYSLCILLVGITYGFPMGIFPAYIGSLLGALASFLISRRFFRAAVAKHIEQSTSISIAKDILLQHQIKVGAHSNHQIAFLLTCSFCSSFCLFFAWLLFRLI